MVFCSNKVEVVQFDCPEERKKQPHVRKAGGWRSFLGKGTPNYGSGEKYRRQGWKEIIPGEKAAIPGPDGTELQKKKSYPVAFKPAAAQGKKTPRAKTNRVGVQQLQDSAVKNNAAPISLTKQVKTRVVRGFQRLFSRGRQGPAPPAEANDVKIGPSGDDPNPASDTAKKDKFRRRYRFYKTRVQPQTEGNGEPKAFDGTGSDEDATAKISSSSIKILPKSSLLGDHQEGAEALHAVVEAEAQGRFREPILVSTTKPCLPDMKVESRKIKVRGNHMEVTVRCIMVKEAPGCTNLLARKGQAAATTSPEATAAPPTTPTTKDEKSAELVVEDIENFDDEM